MASRVSEIQGQVASIRRKPISDDLRSLLETVAAETGVNFEITSGGQSPFGEGPRTGSTRHDDGNAADLKAYVVEDGKKRYLNLNNESDKAKWSEIVRLSVAGGATGIGAGNGSDYMGAHTVHIGYGKPMTWGHGGKSANAPGWLREAYDLGGKTPPLPIAGPAPTPADMSNRIQTARLGADDAGIGTAFSQLERFGQPGATPVTMSDELAYGSGRVRDVPLPRVRPSGPMADVPLPQPRPSSPATSSTPSMFPAMSSGIVDSAQSPRLFAEGVGIPNDQIPGTDATYSGANRMSTGGLGALLGRSVSPATPNPAQRSTTTIAGRPSVPGSLPAARPQTTITGRPDAPIGSMPARSAPDPAGHDQMMAARNPVPRPSVFRTAGGIAGTAQMPADYRPNVPQITPPPSVPKTIPNPAYKAPAPMASPMPATQSPSLAVQRATAAPTNFIQAGQYTYVKGPNGYERVNAPTPATQSAGLAASRAPAPVTRTASNSSSSSSSVPSGYKDLGGGKFQSASGGIYYTRHL